MEKYYMITMNTIYCICHMGIDHNMHSIIDFQPHRIDILDLSTSIVVLETWMDDEMVILEKEFERSF